MKCRLPILVQAQKDPNGGGKGFACAPLFGGHPRCFDLSLSRALSKLAKRYKPNLDQLGRLSRHDALLNAIYNPDCDSRVLKLRLDLGSDVATTRLLFVVMPRFDRWVAFSPSVPELWFDLDAEHLLPQRATEVLTKHFRDAIRAAKRENLWISLPSLAGRAWVATIELDVGVRQKFSASELNQLATLWNSEQASGSEELNRVGRCLDWQYPDGLKRAVLREDEISRLKTALTDSSRRPVAIIGPRLCGKTSIIHEHIRRVVSKRRSAYVNRRGHWLISPQRLISGMSYVGQWESRLLAIVRESYRRGHVLCFGNFLGLFEAGKSSCSQLSVADVLRSHIYRRRVRVLSELTTGQWAAFQERDRGLADQFQAIHIDATNDEDTLRILIHERRQLENEFRCEFHLDAIPTVWEIHRRYDRTAAFPGKAAGFMRRIAAKSKNQTIAAIQIYRAFCSANGISIGLLNSHQALCRREVVEQLRTRIIGQRDGVEASADAVMIAKAGMNDPTKPISTMLFLGPTGVGKTQCAKALAQTMFSDESRMIRFDMNEYSSYAGAARLVGTRQDPDGLLAAAIRRQPYAVILLDEIEKAHADVFDLLLQVLGEGRLTDSRGRTADFSNTVIVMTSNLGVREAARQIGLNSTDSDSNRAYERAARRFFRPEFFNRIDRIVPFSQLDRTEMTEIAKLTIRELLGREGLVSRRTAVRISANAMNFLVRQGYHHRLGARALKRAVESFLGQPVARRLANITRETPTVLDVQRRENGLATTVHPLTDTEPQPERELPEPRLVASSLNAYCDRMRAELETVRPTGAVSVGELTSEQLRYFSLQEQLQATRDSVKLLASTANSISKSSTRIPPRPAGVSRLRGWKGHGPIERTPGELRAAYEIHEFHDELAAQPQVESPDQPPLEQAVRQAALLEAIFRSQNEPERVLALFRPVVESEPIAVELVKSAVRAGLEQALGYDCDEIRTCNLCGAGDLPFPGEVLSFAGAGVRRLLDVECGTHTVELPNGRLLPVIVELLESRAGREVETLAMSELARQRAQFRLREKPSSQAGADPYCTPPVVRRLVVEKFAVDCRTGREQPWPEHHAARHNWILDSLPWPLELNYPSN